MLSIGCGVAYCIAILSWLEQGNSSGSASSDLQLADSTMLFPGIGGLASFVDAFDLCMFILLVVHHHTASIGAGGSGCIAYMGPLLLGQSVFVLATQSGQFASGCKANCLATHIRAFDACYSRYYELSYGWLSGFVSILIGALFLGCLVVGFLVGSRVCAHNLLGLARSQLYLC